MCQVVSFAVANLLCVDGIYQQFAKEDVTALQPVHASSDTKRSAEASRRCDCSPEPSVLR